MTGALRVLVLNERDPQHPRAGGAEVHVAEIFGRLAARGFEVTQAACRFRGAAPEARIGEMRVRRIGRLPGYYARAGWLCARETRRGRFDVVVECLNKLPFYAPVHSAVPVLALCHHLFGETAFLQVSWPLAAAVWSAERLIPRLYRRTPFIAISESTRDDLVSRGVSPAAVRVIPCGIGPPRAAPRPIAARPVRIVYLGRLEPYKRIDLVLEAMARVLARVPDAELVIIGRGSDRPRLERLAEDLGIASHTRFAGFVDDSQRDRLLADARLCVSASRKEGWGLTVIEANALGVPVVATDVPGLRDSVRHDETGWLVSDGPAELLARRLADAITHLLADERRLARLSAGGIAWSRHFDWDQAADRMGEVLRERASER